MVLRVLPCPFCEAMPELSDSPFFPGQFYVDCVACGARGPIGDGRADAVDKWNRCKSAIEMLELAALNPERVADG